MMCEEYIEILFLKATNKTLAAFYTDDDDDVDVEGELFHPTKTIGLVFDFFLFRHWSRAVT